MTRELLAYKCRRCGTLHYPYHTRCKGCGQVEIVKGNIVYDTVPLPKNGKLLTFTHLYALPPDFEMERLSLGVVELENGLRVIGQLRLAEPRLGMPVFGKVEPVRKDEYTRHYGIVFYAEDPEAVGSSKNHEGQTARR